MRGIEQRQSSLFHFVSVEDRVPASHPLRAVRTAAVDVLQVLSPRLTKLYAASGRAAIPAEQLLRALLLWALYGVPSERRLLEELDYNLLFRWFAGLGIEDEVWPHTTFRMNRRRIIASGIAGEFFARCLVRLRGRLIHNDHFNINLSLVETWSGQTTLDDDSDIVELLAPKSDDAPPV
jgi:transposase